MNSNKNEKPFRSINIKLFTAIALGTVTVILPSFSYIFYSIYQEKKVDTIKALELSTKIMSRNLAVSVDFKLEDDAKDILNTLHLNKNIEGALIYSNHLTTFASYYTQEFNETYLKSIVNDIITKNNFQSDITAETDQHLIICKKIQFHQEDDQLGSLCVVSNKKELEQAQSNIFSLILSLLILSVFSILVATKYLKKMFIMPIFNMTKAMQSVTLNHNYNITIKATHNDEFKILFDGFNSMLQTIKEQDKSLKEHTDQLEKKIDEKTKSLQEIIQQFDENIIASKTDLKGNIIYVSKAFCDICQYTESELLGKPHNIIRHQDVSKDTFKDLWTTIKSGKIWKGEIKNLKKDGGFYWVDATIFPEFDSNGTIKYYSAIRHNITSQKEVEDLTKNLEKKIQERTNDLKIEKFKVEEMHKHTIDSIEYASLIQGALIPDNKLFNNYFKDYFAIWHPKDTVGGDIYLFEELRSEDECLLMVIDCTGHGVPGAFVTMLVKAIERQIVAHINLSDDEVSPAKILSIFNRSMKHLLKQENKESISNAGFDGGILYYNKKRKILKFAGAETPLFYVKNDQIHMIKGDRYSVGYKNCDKEYQYKEHIIETEENMRFYLTTDGYLDQNGGEKSFPFGKKRFKNIINQYHNETMADQQEIFLYTLAEYQGDEETNDDITLIGLNI